jgi:N-acetylglucosaminyldiphosphoundecaprenol N-acetyl-beta-D-mannosaminyltransferase
MTGGVPEKVRVLGVEVSRTSYAEMVALCGEWVRERRARRDGRSRYVCVASVHGVMEAEEDANVARILNEADAVTPDGMPLVWALRSFGAKEQQRVYGPTLMLELCRAAAERGDRIFLYGGRPETLPALIEKLRAKFPGIVIAGAYSPPFRALTADEELEVQQRIRESDPDLLFVGISTPKQERWMHAHRETAAGAVLLGVGAAFDFHAGRTRQAPAWMQKRGLEWLFRLLMEPARLWRRYLLVTPKFLPRWAWQWVTINRLARSRSR